MKLRIKVRPNSRQEKVEKTGEDELILWVRQAAKEGKANQAAIELLSKYFNIAKSRISILKGHKAKNKIISID